MKDVDRHNCRGHEHTAGTIGWPRTASTMARTCATCAVKIARKSLRSSGGTGARLTCQCRIGGSARTTDASISYLDLAHVWPIPLDRVDLSPVRPIPA